MQYAFIEDYCLNDDDVSNGYLEVYGGGASLGFRLDSFKFVDYECAELFLHCEVSLKFWFLIKTIICVRYRFALVVNATTCSAHQTTQFVGDVMLILFQRHSIQAESMFVNKMVTLWNPR